MLQIDPRVERTRERVRRATLETLTATGWGGLTIDGVAAAAGVARTTIYRHWADKRALVMDALQARSVQPPPSGETGRPRIVTILRHLVEAMQDPLLPALLDAAARDPELEQLLRADGDRRRAGLTRAVAEVGHPDPELAAMALAGAVLYQRLVGGPPIDPEALTDFVLGEKGRTL